MFSYVLIIHKYYGYYNMLYNIYKFIQTYKNIKSKFDKNNDDWILM